MADDRRRIPLILFFSAAALYFLTRSQPATRPVESIIRDVTVTFDDTVEVVNSVLFDESYDIIVEKDVRQRGVITDVYDIVVDRVVRTELQRSIDVTYSDSVAIATTVELGDQYDLAVERSLYSEVAISDAYDITVDKSIIAKIDRAIDTIYDESMEVKTTVLFSDAYDITVDRLLYSTTYLVDAYTIDVRKSIVAYVDKSVSAIYDELIEVISAVFLPESYIVSIDSDVSSTIGIQDSYDVVVDRIVSSRVDKSISIVYDDVIGVEGVLDIGESYTVSVDSGIGSSVSLQDSYNVSVGKSIAPLITRYITVQYSDEISQLGVLLQDEIYNVIVDSRIRFYTTTLLQDTYIVQVDSSVVARNVQLNRAVDAVYSDSISISGIIQSADTYNVQVDSLVEARTAQIQRSVTVQYSDTLNVSTSSLNVTDTTTITTSLV